jgi:hypothetical protein
VPKRKESIMADTLRGFESYCHDMARDHLEGLDDADLQEVFRHGLDDAHEIADGCVPVYYHEVVNICLDGNLLNQEPEIDGATTPMQMMQYILFDEAARIICWAVEEFKDDEADQRERFYQYLRSECDREEDTDLEEVYWGWRDNPRAGTGADDCDLYEEVFTEWKEE